MEDGQRIITNRLKTARGHLDGIIRMVDADAWCPDIMKQLAAVQGMLEPAAKCSATTSRPMSPKRSARGAAKRSSTS